MDKKVSFAWTSLLINLELFCKPSRSMNLIRFNKHLGFKWHFEALMSISEDFWDLSIFEKYGLLLYDIFVESFEQHIWLSFGISFELGKMANITDSLIYINLPLSLKNVQKCIKCSRNAQMAKFVQNISFLQDIPGFVSFICANMNTHKNMCHARHGTYINHFCKTETFLLSFSSVSMQSITPAATSWRSSCEGGHYLWWHW